MRLKSTSPMINGLCKKKKGVLQLSGLYHNNVVDVDLDRPVVRTREMLLMQGDSYANRIGANVFRRDAPVDLTGCRVFASFYRYASNELLEVEGYTIGNQACVNLPAKCCEVGGHYMLVLKAETGDTILTLRIINGYVLGMYPVIVLDGGANGVYGDVDADNNIIIHGDLADGTYTLKYEYADGTKTTIGTLTVGDNSGSGDDSGDSGDTGGGDSGGGTEDTDVDVPITWILNTKLSKTTGEVESTTDGDYNASDFIEIVSNAQYTIATETDVYNAMNVVYYDANKAFVSYQANCWASNDAVENPSDGTPQSCVLEIPDGAAYLRLRQFETWNVQGASTAYITLSYTLL